MKIVRYLVTFALGEEFSPWRRRGGFERDGSVEERQAYRRQRGAIEVVALLTSMGPENAARASSQMLETRTFDLVISAGLAGGLRPEHRPGSVLAGRAVRRLDDERELAPQGKWLAYAKDLGAREAVFVTASRMATTCEEKRELGKIADAVEMESFAVLEQATGRGIPAIAIRAVADPVETPLPIDFSLVIDAEGHVRPARLARELFRRPTASAGLLRLARQSRRASLALTEFLDHYVAAAAGNLQGAGIRQGT